MANAVSMQFVSHLAVNTANIKKVPRPEAERYHAVGHSIQNGKDVTCEDVWICRMFRELTKPQSIHHTQSLPSLRERWLVRINQEAAYNVCLFIGVLRRGNYLGYNAPITDVRSLPRGIYDGEFHIL